MINDRRIPIVAYGKNRFTSHEYFRYEKTTGEKLEFIRGQLFSMPPVTKEHNVIFSNIFGSIASQLRSKKARVFGSNLRIHIPSGSLYTYPDISIIKNGTILNELTATNPSVIIEILSTGSEEHDSIEKFEMYRHIVSLEEYIIIDSARVRVEVYRAVSNPAWNKEMYTSLDELLIFANAAVEIRLADIYAGIKKGGVILK